jgi:protein-tyrosine phosphatase
MDNLLVVCTANVCCSPMAQAVLTRAAPGMRIASGGLLAVTGMRPHTEVVTLMRAQGYDIGEHRAKAVAPRTLNMATLILVMNARQKNTIERRFPLARGKTFRLLEEADIVEPCTSGQNRHIEAFRQIREGAERWAWHLSRLKMESMFGVHA